MKRTTGHLSEKNGRWYAVLNLYDADGKRHEKWQSLDLAAKKGTKTEANHRLNQILERYNSGDLYLRETMTHAERERNRIADLKVEDYLTEWLTGYKGSVTDSTYESYQMYINVHMISFFKPMKLKVRELTGDDFNEYYAHLRAKGLKGTTYVTDHFKVILKQNGLRKIRFHDLRHPNTMNSHKFSNNNNMSHIIPLPKQIRELM